MDITISGNICLVVFVLLFLESSFFLHCQSLDQLSNFYILVFHSLFQLLPYLLQCNLALCCSTSNACFFFLLLKLQCLSNFGKIPCKTLLVKPPTHVHDCLWLIPLLFKSHPLLSHTVNIQLLMAFFFFLKVWKLKVSHFLWFLKSPADDGHSFHHFPD